MSIDPEQTSPKKRLKKKKKHIKKSAAPFQLVAKTGDAVVDDALEKMRQFSNNIKDQLNQVFTKGNITSKDVKNYLENSSNFSHKQYEKVQQERQKLLENLWTKLGKKAKETHTKKQEDEASKKRSRKFLGSRKNWISMK